jgi:hypothetical protein
MKKIIAFLLVYLFIFSAKAQDENMLYGIVRKNFYSYQTDPVDTSFTYEVFDSAIVRLGKLNTLTGFVENIGTEAASYAVNLTGAALNPYTNSYLFFGGNQFITLNLNTGIIENQVTLSNPNGESYFDNFRFNNSDSTVYGLARRNQYDTQGSFIGAEMFLSKLNAETGEIQQISQNSIGSGFAYSGSAIDPYQMVYYYSIGSSIVGLDMYNGEIYSSFPIPLSDNIMFDNFTYSCADSSLYGLLRQNFYTTVTDSLDPMFGLQNLDSTSIKLAKINTTTGEIVAISANPLAAGGFSINASSAIDPNTMTYYFSTGNNILGVSMITGEITENNNLSFQYGDYFDLMRNIGNCKNANKARLNSNTNSISEINQTKDFSLFPNPVSTELNIIFENELLAGEIQISNQFGQVVFEQALSSANEVQLNTENFASGLYYISLKNQSVKPAKFVVVKK